MPRALKRFEQARTLRYVTFSCYRREPRLSTATACKVFEHTLERVRRWLAQIMKD